jgi:hypothetical protein
MILAHPPEVMSRTPGKEIVRQARIGIGFGQITYATIHDPGRYRMADDLGPDVQALLH